MKIYLTGSIIGSYRAQNTIKALGDAGIEYTYIPTLYFLTKIKYKLPRRIATLISATAIIPLRLILIALSSHVYVLPMNASKIVIAEILIGKLLRKKIIVDYYISLYDTIVNDRKLTSKKSFQGRIALFKDRILLKSASTIIFLNKSESNYYQKVAGVNLNNKSIKIIPLCIDYRSELFHRSPKANDFFNVCWWGTYIPLHGLENLIRAFSHVKNKKIKLYLFGDSDDKATPYIELIEKLGLNEKVTVNNNYSFSNGRLASFLDQNCNLAIGNFGSSEKAKTVLVNKLVDALSLGIPCLTMKTSATTELIANNEGLILTETSPEDIALKIESCAINQAALKNIGEEGKRKYLELFTPDNFKIKLLELLKE